MQIARARSSDAENVFAMTCTLSLDGPPKRTAFDAQFAEVLRSDRSVALVATAGSATVGYVLGAVVPMPIYEGGAAFLQELYVQASDRGDGVGTALVDAFSDWASERGATRVVLATSRAGAFYESIGFTTRAQYYQRPINEQ